MKKVIFYKLKTHGRKESEILTVYSWRTKVE